MPNPSSHSYDVKRTRRRAEYDDTGVPDQHADAAANTDLQRAHPPVKVGNPDRAAGPLGRQGDSRGQPSAEDVERPEADGLRLRSPAFADHDLIPDRYARETGNASPPLDWTHVPKGATELALICEDPDAPNGTFTHWVLAGIPASSTGLGENELPAGTVRGRNDFGQLGWDGPRPPIGDEPHRYFFRLYALDTRLGLEDGVGADELRGAARGHDIAAGTLVGRFGR